MRHGEGLGLTAATGWVLDELQRWGPRFERGELAPSRDAAPPLAPDERFAIDIEGVRAAGLGRPYARGILRATDRRAVLLGEGRQPVREWALGELEAVCALGNWGGLALVHAGGDTELVVGAGPEPPTWRDAAGWLKVEAAFTAAGGRLALWLAELPVSLAPSCPTRPTHPLAISSSR